MSKSAFAATGSPPDGVQAGVQAGAGTDVIDRDRGLLWHPYAPLDGPAPYAVTGAEGVRLKLTDADGAAFDVIDAMSSWWCAVHGYRHPSLDAAVREQTEKFSHVMFGGLTHEPAVELAERLVGMTPEPLQHVFFADSGSVSVEVALKLAIQYQGANGKPLRQKFLALRGGYHGDTFAAMSVCDPVDGMHSSFAGLVTDQHFLPRPPAAGVVADPCGEQGDGARDAPGGPEPAGRPTSDPGQLQAWIAQVEAQAADVHHEVAAIIVEPVLQGAGGMHTYDPQCLRVLRRIADEYGLLLIFDEIATGFGRTGKLFAAEWAAVTPDVMCVGKALTGGYLSLAAVLCTGEVAEAITGSRFKALLHGPTFMANPLACAVAGASLDLLESGSWRDDTARIGRQLESSLAPARAMDCVRQVRIMGSVGVVQLTGQTDIPALTRAAVERGVWLRPFRDLVYTMPPYVSTTAEVAAIGAAITDAVFEVHEKETTPGHG